MRLFALLSAFLFAAAINFALWYWPNRPLPIANPAADQPIAGFSFAPFHDHQSPLTHSYPTATEIETDLKALQGRARSVRTYTSLEGLAIVPAIAGKYGIAVVQSAWLGTELPVNELEIKQLILLANRYPDTIKRVIVGNEVLLRNDLSPAALAAYIRRVKAAVKQPVSYADVWEFWLKYPEMAKEVDFITIHLLPYWEDFPIGVPYAQEHILAIYRRVQAAFPGKPIFIGEVGWPSSGRSREAAVPGRRESAQFLSDFRRLAEREHLDYNYVEAFDQPWKTALEGSVGGTWGILDPHGRPKFTLAGPVEENPEWWIGAAASILAGAAATIWLALQRRVLAPRQLAAAAMLAQALAGMLAALGLHGYLYGYSIWRQIFGLLWLLWAGGLALFAFNDLLRRFTHPPTPARSVAAVLADFREYAALFLPLGRHTVSADKLARFACWRWVWLDEWLLLSAAPLALYQTLMLVFNGRYRDFPINEFLVPALGVLLSRLLGGFTVAGGDVRREGLIAFLVLASAAAMVGVELPANREAVYFALIVAALALPYAACWLAGQRWFRR